MVTIFWNRQQPDAHERFQAWRRQHADGLFINCKTASAGLVHRVECAHLGNFDWMAGTDGDLTVQRKICSLSLRELREWAHVHGMTDLTACQDCGPAEDIELIPAAAQNAAQSGDFDPSDVADARLRVVASIARRQGQPAFRQKLFEIYQGRCAFSGCMIPEILDAAHIVPYRGPHTNHPQNGLLLRTDLHTLFDLGLVAVDTRDMTLIVAPSLADSDYAALDRRPVMRPEDGSMAPSNAALDHHRERAGLAR